MANWMEIHKSADEMQLLLTLHERADLKEIQFEEVKQELRRMGYQLGINEEMIHAMIDKKVYGQPVLIADGQKPGKSKAGFYEYFFDVKAGTGKPKILENGTVDYSQIMEIVEKDQVIAEYHAAVQGEAGYTVTGAMVPAEKIIEVPKHQRDGVTYQDGKYIAMNTGKVTLKNNVIKVDPTLVVNGNVSIAYGNIDFTGDVLVKGDVNAGMIVKAAGNVTIQGAVEGARIEAGKDVIIGQGIHGDGKAYLRADGNMVCKFVEAAEVNILGNLETGYCINSDIVAEGFVDVSKGKGVIMGGTVCGLKGIKAKVIGHKSRMETNVYCGATPQDTALLKRMRQSVKSCKIYLEKLEREEERLFKNVPNREKAIANNIELREQVRLIGEEHGQITSKLKKCSETVDLLLQRISVFHGSAIVATDLFYGGTSVTVSTIQKQESDDLKAVKFVQDGINVASIGL